MKVPILIGVIVMPMHCVVYGLVFAWEETQFQRNLWQRITFLFVIILRRFVYFYKITEMDKNALRVQLRLKN